MRNVNIGEPGQHLSFFVLGPERDVAYGPTADFRSLSSNFGKLRDEAFLFILV
jgi:hypothetical protein